MTPLLIIGSFCLIPEAIPNMIGEKHVISQWILTNLDIIYIPYNVGMALMSVYVTVIIAYQLANSYKFRYSRMCNNGISIILNVSCRIHRRWWNF